MKNILLKLFNLPHTLNIKFSPYINKLYFKANKIQFGKGLVVMGKITVDNQGVIEIGDGFHFVSGKDYNPISSNMQGYIHTQNGAKISIGNNVGMTSVRIWIANGLRVGNRVNIGANVLVMDTDCHQIDYKARCGPRDLIDNLSFNDRDKKIQSSPIVIEDYVWVGAQTIILKGVKIGKHSIIGAGSVVTKDIPANCIAAGNPCKVIRKF